VERQIGPVRIAQSGERRRGMQVQRLNELYAETNQVGFIGRLETDGAPVLEEAFVRVKLA
jgi:HK97 family phage major capsid protein